MKITKCGPKPNCVCTLSQAGEQSFIEVQIFSENPIPKVLKVLEGLGLEILQSEENYIHAVDTTRIFKFKDDVEFEYDSDKSELHFKSASRKGYSDLGTNRRRLEKILRKLSRID